MMPGQRGIAFSEAMYRRLLWMLPRDFRSVFEQDIIESYRDLCRESYARGRMQAVVALWARSAFRLARCGIRERLSLIQDSSASSSHDPIGRRTLGVRELIARIAQDAHLAIRSYVKTPGFAVTAVAIIALGVGATTTIYSVVDGVVLKQLPYPESGRLVYFDNPSHSPPLFRDWQDRTQSFASMGGAWDRDIDLTKAGEPEKLDGALVTREFFTLFGAEPFIGRLFTNDDFQDQPRVVVLDHGLWQRRFGGDESILGTAVTLGGASLIVVGVLDPIFVLPQGIVRSNTDVWLPLDVTRPDIQDRGLYILGVVARLKPDVTLETAHAELSLVAEALAEEFPDQYRRRDGSTRPMTVSPLREALVERHGGMLFILLGAVGLMLVIACANVANLFLARGTDREREMALRAALGAGRGRLVTQLLTESVVLALVGGTLGVAFAFLGVRGFETLNAGLNIPRMDEVGIDLRVLGFALAVSTLTGVAFGLFPAWQASRTDVTQALKESSATPGGGRNRVRSTLVVAEIALALILLVGAGLLFNSFLHRIRVDPGFDPERLVIVPLILNGDTFTDEGRQQFARAVMEQVEGIPGIREATFGVTVPLMYYGPSRCCWRTSGFRTDMGEEPEGATMVHPVSINYFTVLQANLRGREFVRADANTTPVATVISDALAERLFPGIDPMGHTFRGRDTEFVVVGEVSGLHHWGLDEDIEFEMFVPYEVFGGEFRRLNIMVRTSAEPTAVAQALRQAVWAVEPDLPVDEIVTMRQRIATSMTGPRVLSTLLLTFATLAILLAAGGIYGSTLYTVGQRQRELGIRLALGARSGQVVGMVVRQGALLALIGIALGTAGAVGLSRLLNRLVFGITTTDLPTFATVAMLLGLVAIAASYVPARRAARADPMEALRSE